MLRIEPTFTVPPHTQPYRGKFVGRDDELRRIMFYASLLTSGTGRLILISGEAGIGKTRLTNEVCRLAQSEGMRVWTGRCSQFESAVPYFPFVRIIDDI